MQSTVVRCSSCNHALALPEGTGASVVNCAHCEQSTWIWLFPALYRANDRANAQSIVDEGHSSCMNHPNKKATAVCDGCGKYLCGLCNINWGGEHLCSACIEHRKQDGQDGTLKSEYIHYDRLVSTMAVLSLVFFYLGIVLAPIALYIAWRYWKETWRPVPYRKWGMIVAVTLLFLILAGWVAFFAMLITSI